jgi:hypothetical protein
MRIKPLTGEHAAEEYQPTKGYESSDRPKKRSKAGRGHSGRYSRP